MSWLSSIGGTIKKGAGDIWDTGVNVAQTVNPLIGAATEGKAFGVDLPSMRDITGKTAQEEAARKDAKKQAEYNAQLAQIFSRENIYSPEQLAAQTQLSPILMSQLYSSLGLPMPGGAAGGGQAGSSLWNAMTQASQQQRGQEMGGLDIGYQTAVQDLMAKNRTLMGGGSSGHISGQIGQMGSQYMQARPQVEAAYGQRQAGAQQDALGNLMSMAYGKSLGAQPYQPMQPSPSPINTFLPDLIGGAVGGAASALPFLLL